ncbi:MAG: pilus assembly protein N-terminal domain-containing protein [Selenomonadaceae bacterium]|nr:pilus assembly protein N-terminal domain-containing protein [Selenomonadaceae bacterium]
MNLLAKLKKSKRDSQGAKLLGQRCGGSASTLLTLGITTVCAIYGTAPTAYASELVTLNMNESHYVYVGSEITRIAAGNPNIAAVQRLGSSTNDFLLEGHSAGTTTILVWTAYGEMKEYIVVVSPEDPGLAMLIEKSINLPGVHVKKIDNRILLTGTVENQYERNLALQIAQLYVGNTTTNLTTGSNVSAATGATATASGLGQSTTAASGSVIDLLQMVHPTQIRLEAQIIDISAADAKNIGIQYGSASGDDGEFSPGQIYMGESYNRGTGSRSFRNNPADWLWNHRDNIDMYVQALVRDNKARILSRPSISTMSGEEADIHIGGEIKIPKTDGNGSVSYESMDYGIKLKIKPTMGGDGMITSSVHAEVSQLDYANGITYFGSQVPGKLERTANSVVHLAPGTTMVIGGLIDSTESRNIVKVPLLGDIPILGHFFRHTAKSKNKREVIILITPQLVDQDTPAYMSKEMQEYYNTGRQDKADQKPVDLNEPLPPTTEEQLAEKAAEKTAAKIAKEAKVAKEAKQPASHSLIDEARARRDAAKRQQERRETDAASTAEAAALTQQPNAAPTEIEGDILHKYLSGDRAGR